jgi:hypothetical protein
MNCSDRMGSREALCKDVTTFLLPEGGNVERQNRSLAGDL